MFNVKNATTYNTIFHAVLFLMEQSTRERPYSNIDQSLLDNELTINSIVERCNTMRVNPSTVYRHVDMLQNTLVTYGFHVNVKTENEDKLIGLINEFIDFLNKPYEPNGNPYTQFTSQSRDLLNGFYRYLNLARGSVFNIPNPQFFYCAPFNFHQTPFNQGSPRPFCFPFW